MLIISVSYSCQFKIIHFICSYDYLSLLVFFYHNMTHIYISKQYHKNRNLGTVLIIRKNREKKNKQTNLPPAPNSASKLVDFTSHSRFH